jgi:ketosteroid isomerase-like protein
MLQDWADAYGRKDADAYAAMFSDRDDVIVFGTGADEVRVGLRRLPPRA